MPPTTTTARVSGRLGGRGFGCPTAASLGACRRLGGGFPGAGRCSLASGCRRPLRQRRRLGLFFRLRPRRSVHSNYCRPLWRGEGHSFRGAELGRHELFSAGAGLRRGRRRGSRHSTGVGGAAAEGTGVAAVAAALACLSSSAGTRERRRGLLFGGAALARLVKGFVFLAVSTAPACLISGAGVWVRCRGLLLTGAAAPLLVKAPPIARHPNALWSPAAVNFHVFLACRAGPIPNLGDTLSEVLAAAQPLREAKHLGESR